MVANFFNIHFSQNNGLNHKLKATIQLFQRVYFATPHQLEIQLPWLQMYQLHLLKINSLILQNLLGQQTRYF